MVAEAVEAGGLDGGRLGSRDLVSSVNGTLGHRKNDGRTKRFAVARTKRPSEGVCRRNNLEGESDDGQQLVAIVAVVVLLAGKKKNEREKEKEREREAQRVSRHSWQCLGDGGDVSRASWLVAAERGRSRVKRRGGEKRGKGWWAGGLLNRKSPKRFSRKV